LAAAAERAAAQDTGARTVFALPPAEADRAPEPETPGVRVGPLAGAPVPGAGTAAGAGVAPGLAVNAGPVPVRGLGQGVGPVPAQGAAPAPMPGVAPAPVPAQAPAPAPVAPLPAQAQPPVPPQPPVEGEPGDGGRHDAVPVDQSEDHTPPQPHPTTAPTGRRRRAVAQPAQQQEAAIPAQAAAPPAQPLPVPAQATAPEAAVPAQPLPAEAPDATQGRAISVRTLGQGVPFVRQAAQVQQPTATPPPHATNGSGRRRKLGTPPPRPEAQPEAGARPHPEATPTPAQPRRAPGTEGVGRSYAIGAPDANAAEGPEPLDGPGGAVEVADTPRPQPMDDELPPEPLDNPRRLLVWPAPDVTTSEALSTRGYRPVVVHSREEVDAQIAAFPAALFVDPLTGPITRTALQSLRQAAVAAEVPVLVTAGLGQASREAAYGADPAVLLKALAPRDSEQHPPRVLLIEEHAEIALALTATLERRGMQVARAASDADAVTLAGQFRPNLVVMDLMQAKQRQAGIVDWLRANGQLDRTPLVVYTAAVEQADLPKLASGETVLFLAERSTSDEVQGRIVDLLARIGTN
ncbi:response regulator, partial [Streptomyces seoulensis]|uniref:response regulator n=1 Tax=Streptomyces seoulensis TaxID=73044 RepID=UPI0033B74F4D